MSDDTIVEFKPKDNDQKFITIKRPTYYKGCRHSHIEVSESEMSVMCVDCGEKINPIWVLIQQAKRESGIRSGISSLQNKLKKLETKTKCKCDQCGKMTTIDRSVY